MLPPKHLQLRNTDHDNFSKEIIEGFVFQKKRHALHKTHLVEEQDLLGAAIRSFESILPKLQSAFDDNVLFNTYSKEFPRIAHKQSSSIKELNAHMYALEGVGEIHNAFVTLLYEGFYKYAGLSASEMRLKSLFDTTITMYGFDFGEKESLDVSEKDILNILYTYKLTRKTGGIEQANPALVEYPLTLSSRLRVRVEHQQASEDPTVAFTFEHMPLPVGSMEGFDGGTTRFKKLEAFMSTYGLQFNNVHKYYVQYQDMNDHGEATGAVQSLLESEREVLRKIWAALSKYKG